MAPKCNVKVLSRVLKCKSTVIELKEKITVLKFCLGMTCSAVGHESNGRGSTIDTKRSFLKQKHTQHRVIHGSVENGVIRRGQEPNPVFPSGAMVQCLLIQCPQQLNQT